MAKKTFSECNAGDTLYYIVPTKELKIINVVYKKMERWYGEASYTIHFKGYSVAPVHGCIGGRSRNGNLFTTKEEAEDFKNKILNGKKVFLMVKKGDPVYIVIRGESEVYKSEFKCDYKNCIPLKWTFNKFNKAIDSNTSAFDDKFSDYFWFKDKIVEFKVFLDEKDAIKCINEAEKRQKKNATDKYIKQMENHDGKPIAHNDNLGSQLHYGDTVVYIRRTGYHGHPELRKGTIVGESKTTITVFDEDEKKNGKPVGWRRNQYDESDGKHSVQPQSVVLFKLAEVNTKSGFILNKY